MCGRFELYDLPPELIGYFKFLNELPDITPHYNISPGQDILAIVNGFPNLKKFRWGLVPSWAKEEKSAYKMINARSETLLEKSTFKTLLHKKRCIIPANGFFEWKTEGKKKTPFCFTPTKEKLFLFPGLFDLWKGAGGMVLETCTIITTSSNKTFSEIHDRMPVILNPEESNEWLTETEVNKALALLKPPETETITMEEVTGDKLNLLRSR